MFQVLSEMNAAGDAFDLTRPPRLPTATTQGPPRSPSVPLQPVWLGPLRSPCTPAKGPPSSGQIQHGSGREVRKALKV